MQPLHHGSILWKSPNELICSHIHIAYLPLGVDSHQSLCLSDVRPSPIFARVTYNQFTPPARPDSSQRRRRRDADATVLSDLGWRCERGIGSVFLWRQLQLRDHRYAHFPICTYMDHTATCRYPCSQWPHGVVVCRQTTLPCRIGCCVVSWTTAVAETKLVHRAKGATKSEPAMYRCLVVIGSHTFLTIERKIWLMRVLWVWT